MFVETYILRLLAGFLEYGTLSTLADKLYTSQPARVQKVGRRNRYSAF